MRRAQKLALLIFCLSALALQVQPESITVDGGVGTVFEQVFTLVNDEPKPRTLSFVIDEYSTYLEDAASLSEQRVSISAQSSVNMQVRGMVPTTLGPETHRLIYKIMDGPRQVGQIHIRIPVDGEPQLHPKIDVETTDTTEDQAVTARSTLYNFGNVIAYYNLSLLVRENEETLGVIAYPFAVQVLPGGQEEITLLYTDRLEPGNYLVQIDGTVNGVESVSASQPFRVIIADQQKNIQIGDDLILTVKRYDDVPTVEYVIEQGGEELLRDTQVLDADELTIPTRSLPAGDYEVLVRVTHGSGTDTNRIDVRIADRQLISMPVILGILLLGLASLLLTPTLRVRLRLYLLERKIAQREKELNTLIQRAHRLGHYGNT